MGFHSVTSSPDDRDGNASIMRYFLDAKRRQPVPDGRYLAEASDLTCAANTGEVRKFLGKHPERGMPFGFAALPEADLDVLETWLEQGARGPNAAEQAELTVPSAADAGEIAKWESFLNRDDPKYALTARYLFEHFFLAHLRFTTANTDEFFRLVRSTTPPGQPIATIATVRPYDDPGAEPFYYRFEKIHSTIVYKTHIVVEFDDRTLARYRELFIEPEWLEPPHRMAYDEASTANPFLIYAQIHPTCRDFATRYRRSRSGAEECSCCAWSEGYFSLRVLWAFRRAANRSTDHGSSSGLRPPRTGTRPCRSRDRRAPSEESPVPDREETSRSGTRPVRRLNRPSGTPATRYSPTQPESVGRSRPRTPTPSRAAARSRRSTLPGPSSPTRKQHCRWR